MTAVLVEEVDADGGPTGRGLLALQGVLWLVIAVAVLSFTPRSVVAIGSMVGIVVILAGLDEVAEATRAPRWRGLHVLAGGAFVAVGVLAFLEPFQTFGILALLVGWYLVFEGSFDIARSIGAPPGSRWGVTMAAGILEVLIGLWALGYPGRSAWLLVLWVGTGALLRGIGDLSAAVGPREPDPTVGEDVR